MALARGKNRFFRINVGRAWTGSKITSVTNSNKSRIMLSAGDVVISDARPFQTGVPKGFPDLAGWTVKTVTQDMVGSDVAIFTGIEVKSKTGRLAPHQKAIIDIIDKSGGISGVARSVEEAEKLIS